MPICLLFCLRQHFGRVWLAIRKISSRSHVVHVELSEHLPRNACSSGNTGHRLSKTEIVVVTLLPYSEGSLTCRPAGVSREPLLTLDQKCDNLRNLHHPGFQIDIPIVLRVTGYSSRIAVHFEKYRRRRLLVLNCSHSPEILPRITPDTLVKQKCAPLPQKFHGKSPGSHGASPLL